MAAASQGPSAAAAFADFARAVLDAPDRNDFDAAFAATEAGSKTVDDLIAHWAPRAEERVWPAFLNVQRTAWTAEPAVPLRFGVGDRVLANCGPTQAGGMGWQAGTVVNVCYREKPWPPAFLAPYQLQLDHNAMLIYAPVDGDGFCCHVDTTPPDLLARQQELLLGYGDSWEAAEEWMKEGYTSLHVAAGAAGDVKALKALLRRPLPLCVPNHNKNQNQETALHMSARYAQVHCAMLLLAAGNDPRIKDSRGKSATDVAAAKVEAAGDKATPQQRALLALLRRFEEVANAEDGPLAGAAAGRSSSGATA